jgi:L-aminopeptidase/D-esterase-like protein
MGGAPATRETDLLAPENTVQEIDAVVLSGGSAFGLDAAGGVVAGLREAGRGLPVGNIRIPIVPAASCFDMLNGGDKDWGSTSPYAALGRAALAAAAETFAIGTAGAGFGATTVNLKGGLGSASMRLDNGTTVAALVAVNAVGQATVGGTGHFWAAPFEVGGEFGGRGWPSPLPVGAAAVRYKGGARMANTTIAVVATDASLTKAEARRLAVMSHDGFARALWPSHTPSDGDLVFAVTTARSTAAVNMIELGAAGAATMARAIARAVFSAAPSPGDTVPTWHERFGG